MLEYLRIRNLALIADAELEFTPGLNTLTGETGAGKSFVMKAINFIMGEKLSADLVRPGQARAQVEALFSTPDQELILRRELAAETGRSRFYINDTLCSQDSVRALRPRLILHTSQHGQQRLAQPACQAELVDQWMKRPDLLERREALVQAVRAAGERHAALVRRSQELADRRELLELHLQDIQKVNPKPGEEEELERRRAILRDAAQRLQHYDRALGALQGAEGGPGLLEQLGLFERELEALTRYEPDLGGDLEAIAGARSVLEELSRRLRHPPRDKNEEDVDPNAIEARLYALAQLKRKLKRTLPEILALREEVEENLSFLDVCALDIAQAEHARAQATQELQAFLKELNTARAQAADTFCAALEKELAGLGFSEQVRVLPQFEPQALFPDCVEQRPRLLWAPNPGQLPQPLDRIASGGELSRFLLAVVSLQSQQEGLTLIFDEVDAGVGGVTLNRVAERLERLAARSQLLLITHWPQLAARAKNHFQISKTVEHGETFTRCKRLSAEERTAELNRMAGIEA